jgi:hypothetical protein
MWNLSGDDVQRAKEELKGRRAAIQARYESELKQLETAIVDIETFERTALTFMSNFRGEEAPPAQVAEPVPAPESAAADGAGEPSSAESAPVQAAVPEPAASEAAAGEPAANEKAANEKGSSRWRMRLSAAETNP